MNTGGGGGGKHEVSELTTVSLLTQTKHDDGGVTTGEMHH